MIGIIGYMSGGKSYTAVEMMLSKMYHGHTCVSNIRLNCRPVTDYLGLPCVIWKRLYYRLSLDKEDLAPYHGIMSDDYENYPAGSPRGSSTYERDKVFIFLDEISSIFDSMISAADGGVKSVAAWARHTEKRGQILYLIMQFPSELHKRLRVHITQYVQCINTSSVRIPLLGTGLPWFLHGYIIRLDYMPDLETQIGAATWGRYKPKVFKCYNTSQIVVGHQQSSFNLSRPDLSDKLKIEFYQRLLVLAIFLVLGVQVWLMSCVKLKPAL